MGLADNAARRATTVKASDLVKGGATQSEARRFAAIANAPKPTTKPVTAKQLLAAGETPGEAQRFANMAAAAAQRQSTTSTTPAQQPARVNNPPRNNSSSNNKNRGSSTTSGGASGSGGNQSGGSQQSATPPSSSSGGGSGSGSSSGSGDSGSSTTSPPPVKSAPIDTVVFADETFAEQFIVDVLFEDLVGQELLTIARNDTVNGQDVVYQPIKNLGLLQSTYNPGNIINLSETSLTYFENFIIKLNDKIPTIKNGPNGTNYYVDPKNGDIVIELKNLEEDEQVEVQIATSGTIEELGI